MLSALFGHTHPPPPIPPFLLKQNLSPKVIARSDITRSSYIQERVNKHIINAIAQHIPFMMYITDLLGSYLAWMNIGKIHKPKISVLST